MSLRDIVRGLATLWEPPSARPTVRDILDRQQRYEQRWPWPRPTPYRCPVCEGRGRVPEGRMAANSIPCQACRSTGIVWSRD